MNPWRHHSHQSSLSLYSHSNCFFPFSIIEITGFFLSLHFFLFGFRAISKRCDRCFWVILTFWFFFKVRLEKLLRKFLKVQGTFRYWCTYNIIIISSSSSRSRSSSIVVVDVMCKVTWDFSKPQHFLLRNKNIEIALNLNVFQSSLFDVQ